MGIIAIAWTFIMVWMLFYAIMKDFTRKRLWVFLGATFGVVLAIMALTAMFIWGRKISAASTLILLFLSGIVFIKAIRGKYWGGAVNNLIGTAFAIGMLYGAKVISEGPIQESCLVIFVCAVYYAFTRKIPDVWKEPNNES